MWEHIFNLSRRIVSLFPFLKARIPRSVFDTVKDYLRAKKIPSMSDRKYFENDILPCLSSANFSKVLFVGCKRYTRKYRNWFLDSDTEYWTTDIKPEAAAWGENHRHVICDVQELDAHFRLRAFDVVLLNGVFGYGVDDEVTMNRSLVAIHRVLKPSGILMVGWDRGLTPDPCGLANMEMLFNHGTRLGLPKRKSFADVPHVYDFFIAK